MDWSFVGRDLTDVDMSAKKSASVLVDTDLSHSKAKNVLAITDLDENSGYGNVAVGDPGIENSRIEERVAMALVETMHDHLVFHNAPGKRLA